MGSVVFAADDGVHGRELWVSDGAGARLVADINPGLAASNPDSLTVINGRVVFVATSADGGRELWVVDDQGPPIRLIDAYPGATSSNPVILKAVGDQLFFTALTPDAGRELFVTDGTAAGTHLVKDIRPGTSSSGVTYVGAVGDYIVFLASDGVNGREVWASDGTAAGTVMLRDITPGSGGVGISFDPVTQTSYVQTREVDGKLQFYVGAVPNPPQWWETDGTPGGTQLVPTPDLSPVTNRVHPVTIAGKTYFVGNDGSGWSAWVTDGTPAGTVRLTTATSSNAFGAHFTAAGGKVVFVATDPTHGTELWVTDGTTAGTGLLKEIVPDFYSTSILEIEGYGANALFGARLADNNWGVWITDGTESGTQLLKALSNFSGAPFVPVGQVDGKFLFRVTMQGIGTNTEQLWATDGTAGGTVQLATYVQSSPRAELPTDFMKVGEHYVYVAGSIAGGRELWTTDGTTAGTRMLFDSLPGSQDGELSNFRVVDGVLYFSARTAQTGLELWRTDGTVAGTRLVIDANSAIDASAGTTVLSDYAALNGGSIFHTETESGRVEHWFTDGTAAGTVLLLGNDAWNYSLFEVGGKFYFLADIPGRGIELWVTDGTVAGTHVTREIGAGSASGLSGSAVLRPFGDKVLFTTANGSAELWITDGTTDGTIRLFQSPGSTLTPRLFDGRAFVEVNSGGGSQLWTTDGTVAGTINLGPSAISYGGIQGLDDIIQVGNRWLFVGRDAGGQPELWSTDGTVAGTAMVADINASGGSFPRGFATVGDQAFFVAGDGGGGGDLWVTDGTSAGTGKVWDVTDNNVTARVLGVEFGFGPSGQMTYGEVETVGGRILFVGEITGSVGATLYASDGTAAGTVALGFAGPLESNYVFHEGRLIFASRQQSGPDQLWSTDGTAAGTMRIDPGGINYSASFSAFGPAVLLDGDVVFVGYDSEPSGLWTTDGSVAGTRRITDVAPMFSESIISLGSRLVFAADAGGGNVELWVADTTGASRVELLPGAEGSYPYQFTLLDGWVYFVALTGGDHYELWKTDGTVAGTARALDLNLGSADDYIRLSVVSGRLAFMADDGINGFELYAFDGTSATRITSASVPAGSSPGPVTELPTTPPPPTINGTARSETVNGTALAEFINGLGGNDTLNGLAGDDTLDGGDGADQLFGGLGIDTLIGGSGNDRLDGGEGADLLRGGVGSDVYVVGEGDTVEELAGEGLDSVIASVSFVLPDHVENLTLTTIRPINGYGNDLANNITGTNYENRLEGGGGVDTINGLNGDDIILGGSGGDIIQGGGGNDIITGGLGNDQMRGGSGADIFVVLQESIGGNETDTLKDFYVSQGDIIDLSAIDANALVDGDQAFSLVSSFSKAAGQMTLTYVASQAVTLLKLDTNGDGRFDYQMKINGNVTEASGDWQL